MRQGLRNLEKKVEQLALAQERGVEDGEGSTPVAPSNDAAVEVVVATGKSGSVDGEGTSTIREELRALKKKVDIIAANVLGEAEGDSMDIATTGTPPEGKELLHSNDDDNESLMHVGTADDIASIDTSANNTESRSPTDDEGEAMAEKDNLQQEQEGGGVVPRVLPQRVKARSNWAKIRMNRAFLVKKIRRQARIYAIQGSIWGHQPVHRFCIGLDCLVSPV